MMGSRASTLLRDEELEEIKKETGCEFGLGGGKAARRLRLASVLTAVVAEVLIWGAVTLLGGFHAASGALGNQRLEYLYVHL